jgi:glycine oxidase
VVLLERGRVGGEASSAAGGILIPANAPDLPPALLEFWKASHALYPDFVAETRELTGQAFEFRVCGRLCIGFGDEDIAYLRQTFALQAPAGIPAEWLTPDDIHAAEPSVAPDARGAIYYPDHALLDNPRFTRALGDAARLARARMVENCLVTGLRIEGERLRGVETATGPVDAPVVVNCAGCWAGRLDPRVPQPVRPAKGQMLAVDRGNLVLRHIVEGGGGSAVPRADGRTQIGATVHDVGYDKDVIAGDIFGLFQRTVRLVPELARARFIEAWAGLRPVCPDRLPLIGADPSVEGLYWATGHFTMGILGAPATAWAIVDLVERGTTSIPVETFGPARFA